MLLWLAVLYFSLRRLLFNEVWVWVYRVWVCRPWRISVGCGRFIQSLNKTATAYKKLPQPNIRLWQFFICPFVVLFFTFFVVFIQKLTKTLFGVLHIWYYCSFISISKYKLQLKHKLNSNSNLIKNTTSV